MRALKQKPRLPERRTSALSQPLAKSPERLAIGSPDNAQEREADRVAEKALLAPESRSSRNCPCGGGCPKCSGERGRLAPISSIDSSTAGASSLGRALLRSSGHPLEPTTRAFIEPRLGHDFSRVRVHTDQRAAQTARALGARAYTIGRDIVFGELQYRPHTNEGLNLIAHELAHVVQQRHGDGGALIQRRLLVTGSTVDIRALLDLLEPASGLRLKFDAKTHTIVATGFVPRPPSAVLALRLSEIINDEKRDAEINLGRKQQAVGVGAFPADLEQKRLVQEIRIDHVLALEHGAPGSGVAKLAHEIVENYEGHDPALLEFKWKDAFSLVHEKAIEVENLVATELTGKRHDRRNTFAVVIGRAPDQVTRTIEDSGGGSFLVYDQTLRGDGRFRNVRRVPRVPVARFEINFKPGSSELSSAAVSALERITTVMKTIPTASARVESYATAGAPKDSQSFMAARRADLVTEEIVRRTNDFEVTSWRRFDVDQFENSSSDRIVVTLERPDI